MHSHSYQNILFEKSRIIALITHILPFESSVELAIAIRPSFTEPIQKWVVYYRKYRTFAFINEWKQVKYEEIVKKPIVVSGLSPNCDYECFIELITRTGNRVKTPKRLFRTGSPIGTIVNYHHPKDRTYDFSGRFTCSPSIVKLPSGRLLVSNDYYKRNGGQNLTKIFYSDDEGASFHHLCDLYPCFWGKLFLHRNDLYMLATSTEYGDLIISKSIDEGASFSEPVVIMKGGDAIKGGPHKAPMPILHAKGRLWTAIDYGSWTRGGHDSCMASIADDADLMDPDNWIISKPLKYNPKWKGTVQGTGKFSGLEGNAVRSRENQILNILRYNTAGGTPNYGKILVLIVDESDLRNPLIFHQIVDCPGNMSKFSVLYDTSTDGYLSLVNRVDSSNIRQRNIVSLIYSKDLSNWVVINDILRIVGDAKKVAAQYIDFILDENKIRFVSRTAINDADNFHNANYISYHEIVNYQDLIKKRLNMQKKDRKKDVVN